MVQMGNLTDTWFSHTDVNSLMIDCSSGSNFYGRIVLPEGTYNYTFTVGLQAATGTLTLDGSCKEVYVNL